MKAAGYTREPGAGGYTLLELLVVLAIVAILSIIAIAGFNNMRQRAYNAAAVSEADIGRGAQSRFQLDHDTYTGSLDNLRGVDKNLATTQGVTFETIAGDAGSFTIVTRHSSGNRSYTATVSGIK